MSRMILLIVLLCCVGCSSEPASPPQKQSGQKELLLFVGVSMLEPVKELLAVFEKQTGAKATLSYGGSADLLQSISLNKIGDIYFPGMQSFVDDAVSMGIIAEQRQVGVNQAVLYVKKGNPLSLSGDLGELLRPDVQVAIGHPDLGAIGKETRRILQAKGIYDQVVAASAMMQPDSRGLSGALREGKVDVVISWKAMLTVGDNDRYMDMLPIQGNFAQPGKMVMAVTTFSRQPELAQRFLELCASPDGRAVFQKHGF